MRTIVFLLTLFIVINSFGQHTFRGQIVSVIDNRPIAHFTFRVDKEKLVETDSLGFFEIETTKNKVRLSTIFDLFSFDTTLNYTKDDKIQLFTVRDYDTALAAYDIEHKTFKLFCGLSLAPIAMMPYDFKFEKQFKITYYIIGDFLPSTSSIEQMTGYNKVIAAYLDKMYGDTWRNTVRQDVLGIPKKAYR